MAPGRLARPAAFALRQLAFPSRWESLRKGSALRSRALGNRALPGAVRHLMPLGEPPLDLGYAPHAEAIPDRRRQVDASPLAFAVFRLGCGAEDVVRIVFLERTDVLPLRIASDVIGTDGNPSVLQQGLLCPWLIPGDERVDAFLRPFSSMSS
jgi:hypothetical protein